jgi:hypothetical protein
VLGGTFFNGVEYGDVEQIDVVRGEGNGFGVPHDD